MVFIGIIALLAALDLCLKEIIEEQDEAVFPKEVKSAKGRIMLHKSHNSGFSFGFLKNRPELVQMLPLGVASFLGGMLVCLLQKKGGGLKKLALAVTLGGAVSNLYDRLFRRYVVDYFSLQYGKLKKVVFNMGDFFIFLGAGLFLLSEIIQSFKEK